MAHRHPFASDDWIAAAERTAQALLDGVDPPATGKFTYAECLTDAPIARADGKACGYVMRFDGPTVTIRGGASEDEAADCLVIMDFAAAEATTKVPFGPDLVALGRQAYANGKLVLRGATAGMPISMDAFHDAMIDQTGPVAAPAR